MKQTRNGTGVNKMKKIEPTHESRKWKEAATTTPNTQNYTQARYVLQHLVCVAVCPYVDLVI